MTLLVGRLATASSWGARVTCEPPGDRFDTVQFWVPADGDVIYRLRSFGLDRRCRVHRLRRPDDDVQAFLRDDLDYRYGALVTSVTVATANASVGGYPFWSPDGRAYGQHPPVPVERWLATIDDLLTRPFAARETMNLATLTESQDFWDDESRYPAMMVVHGEFWADRAVLADAVTTRYGESEVKDLTPYRYSGPPEWEPGYDLFRRFPPSRDEIDLWRTEERGIIVEVCHEDKELPMEILAGIGDLTAR